MLLDILTKNFGLPEKEARKYLPITRKTARALSDRFVTDATYWLDIAFVEFFQEPQVFSDGSYVINGYLPRKIAAKMINDYYDEEIRPEDLTLTSVGFGEPPEDVEGRDELPDECWYTGADKDSDWKVWVFV